MKKGTSILMDQDYSQALVGAALDSGMASIVDPEGHLKTFNIAGNVGRSLVHHRATRKFRSAALEMALIFDSVVLSGVHPLICVEPLRREGLVLTNFNQATGDPTDQDSDIVGVFVRESRSWLVRPTLRRINRVHREAGLDPVSYRIISAAFDAVEYACFADANLPKLIKTLSMLALDSAPLDSVDQECLGLLNEMISCFARPDIASAPLALLCAMAEIESAWNLCVMSIAFSMPFLSNRPALGDWENREDPKLADTFSLCQLTMHEDLGYAPAVNTVDDVLRLRNDKRIVRFRELLFEWHKNLSSGNARMLTKIKTDIRKANKELRHLKKWKKVDRWLFWAQLPTALIPVLSTIVTVASVGTHLWIEKTEQENSWVGIGR